jgi:hypothetical protein
VDDLARDYLLLSLAAGRLQEGIVDAYHGPPELEDAARGDPVTASDVVSRASRLRERVAHEAAGQRARWLNGQLLALETIARRLAGEEIGYAEEVERCFDAPASATLPEQYDRAHAELDALLPPGPDLRTRLAARNERLAIPRDRLPQVIDFALAEISSHCQRRFRLPPGESLTVALVNDQPWAAYNWYEGELRSRIEVNTDLPVRATGVIGLLCHEAYPGHHLEHAWKEQRLVRELGLTESTVQLINTPEAYISEGLAELGRRYVLDDGEWQELLLAICSRSGLEMTQEQAAHEWHIDQALRSLRGSSGDAALMLHVEGRPMTEILEFLEHRALRTPDEAAKDIAFVTHPLWRAYVFCYAGGEALLEQWCSAAGNLPAQRERFFRLLTEQLTPSDIRAELPAPV